jgi:pimeloyl-ACP methyl ester carboxylesterase
MSPRTSWLLLRGLGRESRHWRSFPRQLAEAAGGVEVLCLDLPGFGTEHRRRSPASVARIADDVRERFGSSSRSRGGTRWSILGLSLGGMVALDWCSRYPDDFARCVIVNSSARPSPPLERLRPAGLRSLVPRDAMQQWRLECPPRPSSIVAQLRAAMTYELPDQVAAPVLVLTSTADELVSHRCSRRIASHLGAELRVHHRAGHDLALDDPAWVCARIADDWLS